MEINETYRSTVTGMAGIIYEINMLGMVKLFVKFSNSQDGCEYVDFYNLEPCEKTDLLFDYDEYKIDY